jgi:hypothetical protein
MRFDRQRLMWGLAINMMGGWTSMVADRQELPVDPAIWVVGVLAVSSVAGGLIQPGKLAERAALIVPFAAYASSVFFLSRSYMLFRGGRIFMPELALPAVCALPIFGLIFLLVGRSGRR